jgi:septal ring factor EnvC (AmiA/AmiB activator)
VPRPERVRRAALPLLLAAMLSCAAARADDTPQDRLQAVEKALEQSRQQQQQLSQEAVSLAAELERLRIQEVAAAQSAQAHEEALTRLETQVATLAQEQQAKTDELVRRRQAQTQLVTALLRLARNPPSGLALAEGSPVDLLRGGILLSASVPPLVERANLLSIEVKTLADLRDQIREAEASHRIESDSLAKEEVRVHDLINEKAALQEKTTQDAAASAQQVLKLAAQASDLKDLIDRAEAEARRREVEAAKEREAKLAAIVPPPTIERGGGGPEVQAAVPSPALIDPMRPASIRPFSEARGRLLYPAAGSLVLAFGASDSAGGTSKGMTLETRAGAQVVAPFDGRVLFAGPFKGYGRILIIGHGDGYHSLVAGLDQIDSSVGQWLIAGEPIGTMPAGEAKPRLYLELRHDGQPINPLPWLATRDAKVKG